MYALRAIRAFGPIDALSIRRDPLLSWIVVLPIAVALLARWVLPEVLSQLGRTFNQPLDAVYVPTVGVEMLLFAPALVGMIVGFLLLDQRDDRTLQALRVSPMPMGWYLAYRLGVPMFISVLLTLVTFPLANLPNLGFGTLLLALSAAPTAPLMALFMAAFAENKVQGFALVKALGVVLPLPLVAYFVDSPWTVLIAVVPTYWPARLYWSLLEGSPDGWLFLVGGLVYQGLLVALLLRTFNRRSSRALG